MYIFGGEKSYDHFNKQRKCLNDIRAINLITLEWDWPLIITGSNSKYKLLVLIEPRRSHAGILIQN